MQAPLPEHAPLQPAKTPLPLVLIVSVTVVPLLNEALQTLPQLTPPGLLVTVPRVAAVPFLVTASEKVGTAVLIMNVNALDAVAPGFMAVTWAVPAAAMSLAEMAALTCVALTKVVERAAPFQFTVAPETKLLPLTVSVKAAPPAVALVGESDVSEGAVGIDTVNVNAFDAVVPGLIAVTWAVPAAAMSLAGMAALTCVALTKVVERAAPFQFTVAPETKLLPLTVSVKAAPPAVALAGESEVSEGAVGFDTVNVNALDAVAPGLMAVTWAVPAAAMSLAGMAALTCVALTKVVERAAPFQFTVAPETKLLPLTVSVKAAPPAVALAGESEVSEGAVGFDTVNVNAFDAVVPGFMAVTWAVPAAAMSLAGMAARHLRRADEGRGAGGAVPVHRRARDEVAAVDGEREGRAPGGRAGRRERSESGGRDRGTPGAELHQAANRRNASAVDDEEHVQARRRQVGIGRRRDIECAADCRVLQHVQALVLIEGVRDRSEPDQRHFADAGRVRALDRELLAVTDAGRHRAHGRTGALEQVRRRKDFDGRRVVAADRQHTAIGQQQGGRVVQAAHGLRLPAESSFRWPGSTVRPTRPAVAVLLKPLPEVPPVASTVPSGNKVALSWRRGWLIEPVKRHAGAGAFRSMISAVAVGGSPPPTTRTLPASYITAEP